MNRNHNKCFKFLKKKCLEISQAANNEITNTPEHTALIDAAAAIQDVLEKNGYWKDHG